MIALVFNDVFCNILMFRGLKINSNKFHPNPDFSILYFQFFC